MTKKAQMELRRLGLLVAVMAVLLSLNACDDDEDGAGPSPSSATATSTVQVSNPTSTATRTSTQPVQARTATPTTQAQAGTPTPTTPPEAGTPTPTATALAIAGSYSSAIPLDDSQSANLNFTAEADGQATGTLEIVGPASASFTGSLLGSVFAAADFSVSLGFANISGSVDLSTGAFHFFGSITIDGETTSYDLSGNVPLTPDGTGSVTAIIDNQTSSSALTVGAGPTPLPTQTPKIIVGGCGNGVFDVTLSNVSGDSNLIGSSATLGNVTALDAADSLGGFVWTISANVCDPGFGQVAPGVLITGSGITTRIQPGTYTLNSTTPPFLGLAFSERKFTLGDPSQTFTHFWGSTGGALVIEDAGGGALSVHVNSATMGPHPLIAGGLGTFTLNLSGTITAVNH